MRQRNVLRVNAIEEREEYRDAVAEILRLVQNDHSVTLLEIAEAIDVSLGTISNAANKKADLSATFLRRIGRVYGPAALDPFHRLYGARGVARENDEDEDILPAILGLGTRISIDRSPASPGGVTEVLVERLGQLPDLRRARRLIDARIAQIEMERAAA